MEIAKQYIKKIKEKFSLDDVKKILHSFKDLKVLVIGDTILDEYCFVESKGRAMKDPILSVNYEREEMYAGGILAIANHVSNFVGKVTVLTLLGDNYDRKDFIMEKLNQNITPKFFVKENTPTIRKKRYINWLRNEKLFKIEYMDDSSINENLEKEIIDFLEQNISNFDLVMVGDFGHGFITERIIKLLEEKSKFLAVNAQTNSANFGFNYITKYRKPSFVSTDGMEIRYAVGENLDNPTYLINKLAEKTNFKRILVTLGKQGAVYFNQGAINTGPAFVFKTTDVVGAGDAVFSVISLFSQQNVDNELVPFIANCVGGIAVNIMGNKESVREEQLENFIEKIYKEAEEEEINQYFSSISSTLKNLDKGNVTNFVKTLLETYRQDKVIYIFGNGGSAATASHFCGDLVKGASYGLEKRFKAVCLNDNIPAMMSIANDISYNHIFVEQLKNFLQKDDLVIGISGSGNSENVVRALEYARGKGAKTVAICGYQGGKINEISDISIHAKVDDMEISEDIHNLVIIHCVKRMLTTELNNTNLGEEYVKRTAANA